MNKELLKGTTPLLILQLLTESDKYGYQITKEIEKRSESLFTLKEGTLYPILHSLENEQIIESYWEQTQSARKRKYYKITDKGKKIFDAKKNEWNEYSNGVKKVLEGGFYIEPASY